MLVACNATFVKAPPAYTFPALSRASARIEPPGPAGPGPRLDQFVPSHFATPPTAEPMTLNEPARYSVPEFGSRSMALTVLFAPGMVPMLIQLASVKGAVAP